MRGKGEGRCEGGENERAKGEEGRIICGKGDEREGIRRRD